jgi:serine/threonine protein kinase
MGEVYRALDKNLGRRVAIKILPEGFSTDLERLARFEREAKLLAALNHPNIAAIHGVEGTEGRRLLVLELVEGDTLKARLDKGPLAVAEALDTCRQIAEGLEAAHEKGIIHRDLKPGNIMLTPEGKVKILDFGLAKAYTTETTQIDIANSPTITGQMTEPGVILGTAAYMSPEQARGRSVDKRADIWAFGCILYECLTGRRPFEGDTVSETLASILKGEPEWKALPVSLPWKITDLLRCCLQKNPHDRLHDMGDARIEIEEAAKYPTRPTETVPSPIWRKLLPWALTAAVSAGAIWIWILSSARTPQEIVRSTINLPASQRLTGGSSTEDLSGGFSRPSCRAFCISPDGANLVYSAVSEKMTMLYIRPLSQTEAKPIPGTQGGVMPFFSPDGKWIGFFTDDKLKKVALAGGPPVTLCDAFPSGASWGSKGFIVFDNGKTLSKIREEGGAPEILTTLQKGEGFHQLPEILPNGRAILYTSATGSGWFADWKIVAQSLETGKRKVVVEGADPRFLPTGHLLFARNGTLMAVSFDPDTLELRGNPVPVLEDVMQALFSVWMDSTYASAQYAVSNSGILASVPGGVYPEVKQALVWVDLKGAVRPSGIPNQLYYSPRISPDGQQIAFTSFYKERNLWVIDIERGSARKLTFEGEADVACWGPDNRSLTFDWVGAVPGNGIFVKSVDTGVEASSLFKNELRRFPIAWTPDGKLLAFMQEKDIWVFHADDQRIEQVTKTPNNILWPTLSPDGRWIAYSSNESGRYEIYVQSFPAPGTRYMLSTEGGSEPVWAPKAQQLYFRNGNKMMVVDFRPEVNNVLAKPRELFEGQYDFDSPIRSYDIYPDGNRFLMRQLSDQPPQPVRQIQIVQNWFEELKRLVPARKK